MTNEILLIILGILVYFFFRNFAICRTRNKMVDYASKISKEIIFSESPLATEFLKTWKKYGNQPSYEYMLLKFWVLPSFFLKEFKKQCEEVQP